jgi:hypothetical protein
MAAVAVPDDPADGVARPAGDRATDRRVQEGAWSRYRREHGRPGAMVSIGIESRWHDEEAL